MTLSQTAKQQKALDVKFSGYAAGNRYDMYIFDFYEDGKLVDQIYYRADKKDA